MRDLSVAGAQLRLNGRPLFLKGLNWYEETSEHGRAMTPAEYDRELGHITALGADFIRNCVYNRHPYVYDWADEHGVYVQEVPQDRGDDAGDAVRQEVGGTQDVRPAVGERVERQGQRGGQQQHHRDLHHAEEQHPREALQEGRLLKGEGVVVQPGEADGGRTQAQRTGADRGEQALVDGVAEREDEGEQEEGDEGEEEPPGGAIRAGGAPAARCGLPRPADRGAHRALLALRPLASRLSTVLC
ncbi:glycoside hydrolase family 2 TIM barrel-domain containing protein [Streptomyces sp. NPDC050619]|uniref:glycoside hydrolase family 2 TIM barrel-domain containing protein n=1 Tax=Streptomyces sp. NPDC050619 TaxID=3157214 RepID=UPI00344ABDB0